ncbi:MAG TPA: hypothetical protein VEW25_08475 [Allosphingosinicella sp.]|nr:hypothetical protein [Allosphingosinicella sp.]
MANDGEEWATVREDERARAARRRAWAAGTGWGCHLPPNHVGLALSGGGIRSATFSLGLMKSLSNARLIHSIDYLSTVSGGGYAGSFYCSLFVPNNLRGPAPTATPGCEDGPAIAESLGCDVLGSPIGREAVSQLRQGGHYLAPNGTSDAVFAAVIAVRNWFAVAITTGLALLGLFFFINFAVSAAVPFLDRAGSYARKFAVSRDEYGAWRMLLTAMALWPAACAWGFWFARSGSIPLSRWGRLFSMQLVVAGLIFLLALLWPGNREGWHGMLRVIILAVAAFSVLAYVLAEAMTFWQDVREGSDGRTEDCVDALSQEDRVRNLLGRWLMFGTLTLVCTGLLALIYWIAREQIWRSSGAMIGILGSPSSGATVLIATLFGSMFLSRWLLWRENANPVATGRFALVVPRARRILALSAGTILLAAFVTFWAAMAVGASEWIKDNVGTAWENIGEQAPELLLWFKNNPWAAKAPAGFEANLLLLALALIILMIAYLLGNVDSILNRSSLSAFYSSRLRTAYLGATNMRRWEQVPLPDGERAHARRAADEPPPPAGKDGARKGKAVDQDDPNDEITLDAYFDDSVMAPIHLINVTINETTSKSSRVIQRDRKGKSMTVAPSGYLYPPHSPSRPLTVVRRELAEDLPLSSWMAISGAAFTTGAGHHTSLGTAMLASLTNMRLGYWWRSTKPRRFGLRRPRHLVQRYLLRELWASYEGTEGDRWYLSDGGHYENTGVYELVRRRVPFIIASDNGADPNYEFSDLVSLIRKLRIDFEAEVEFVDEDELETLFGETPLRDVFGTLEEIQSTGKQAAKAAANPARSQPKAGPYATLARIRYHGLADATADDRRGTPPSTLLLIKPRVTGRELPDLLQYRQANAAFPQQPTTNQFFDEAQWESYYRLGQLIGDAIFDKKRFPGEAAGAKWHPWKLEPLPA